MKITQGDNVATLASSTDRWESADESFALWLNTTFPPAGRVVPELVEELRHHGLAVDGQEPYPDAPTLAQLDALIDSIKPLSDDHIVYHEDGTWSVGGEA